ncbi:hypothetical protein AAC387_Pa01g2571 [Persea americana]
MIKSTNVAPVNPSQSQLVPTNMHPVSFATSFGSSLEASHETPAVTSPENRHLPRLENQLVRLSMNQPDIHAIHTTSSTIAPPDLWSHW